MYTKCYAFLNSMFLLLLLFQLGLSVLRDGKA